MPLPQEEDLKVAAAFMRASKYDATKFGHVISMPKLNGLRCMYIPGRGFYSRKGLRWHDSVLAHINIPDQEHIIDGELYCHDMRLQDIVSAVGVTRHEPGEGYLNVTFHAFDIVCEREQALARMYKLSNLPVSSTFAPVDWKVCYTRELIDREYAKYVNANYEGQMLKSIFGHYMPQGTTERPTMNLQKRKAFLDREFTCVGIVLSEASRIKGRVGALEFITDRGTKFEVGTGITDVERAEYAANPPIGRKATIRFLMLSKDGIPQNNSFVAWREGV